jgi:hypothetical protein
MYSYALTSHVAIPIIDISIKFDRIINIQFILMDYFDKPILVVVV